MAPAAQPTTVLRRTKPGGHRWHRWVREPALPAGIFLGLLVMTALLAEVLPIADPRAADLTAGLVAPFTSLAHPLGTDPIGRDILVRLVFGARVSLVVGFASVLLAAVVGSLAGLVAGYLGGWADALLMRFGDVQLSLPSFILALTIIAIFGAGELNVILALGVAGWVRYARVVRSDVLPLRNAEYVEAARGLGCSALRVMFRHILPNVQGPILVLATFGVGANIIAESSLSFLGLGVDPQTPSWGVMLADGRSYLELAWWVAALPGLAISLTVLCTNILGDWLRDYLDPRMKASRSSAPATTGIEAPQMRA